MRLRNQSILGEDLSLRGLSRRVNCMMLMVLPAMVADAVAGGLFGGLPGRSATRLRPSAMRSENFDDSWGTPSRKHVCLASRCPSRSLPSGRAPNQSPPRRFRLSHATAASQPLCGFAPTISQSPSARLPIPRLPAQPIRSRLTPRAPRASQSSPRPHTPENSVTAASPPAAEPAAHSSPTLVPVLPGAP